MAVPKFEYFPTRAAFDTARGATTVFNNSVVFIEDTMELFTHGHFWTVSNLSQYYNSSTQKLQLKNGSNVISEMDASPFIKDGMLDSVELITTPEGSSAVLSVNGTNYPIVELDVSELQKVSQNGDEFYVIQNSNETKAYKIAKEENDDIGFVFTQYGSFICTTDETDVPLYFYNGVSTESLYPDGSWKSVTIDNIPFSIGSNTYYGINGQDMSVEDLDATETTSSVSNDGYPTLPYLKFTFNTFNGEPTHTVIRVSIAELFTVYNGDNVLLSSNYVKAQVYAEPAVGDKVDIAVGKLAKGVADNAAAIATKQATITGAATSITTNNLTASKALVSDANGKVAVSSVTSTELGYLSGVTSSIQTQLNAKANIADLGWVEH